MVLEAELEEVLEEDQEEVLEEVLVVVLEAVELQLPQSDKPCPFLYLNLTQ